MTLHTFGDSHAYFGWNKIEGIICHNQNSTLCYSFGRDKLNRINIKNEGVCENDTVVFCLGEIDCRCHIHKYITTENTYQQLTDPIIHSYFEAIKENVNMYNKLKVCVYNVLPPVTKENTHYNLEYPYLGTNEERKNYVLYFNQKIKEYCEQNNYIFIDVYEKYCNEEGYLNKQLTDGSVHMKNEIHLKNFLIENKIL